MEELFRSYLSFLSALGQVLENLTVLSERKLAAAQADDLAALNELLNQEQALSLSFRGLEQTRDKLLPQLGLTGVPLTKVPDRCPPALQAEARQTVENLREKYRVYQQAAGKTRTVLERNLQEVERVLAEMGGPPAEAAGPGYHSESETAPPPSMRTDFRC